MKKQVVEILQQRIKDLEKIIKMQEDMLDMLKKKDQAYQPVFTLPYLRTTDDDEQKSVDLPYLTITTTKMK